MALVLPPPRWGLGAMKADRSWLFRLAFGGLRPRGLLVGATGGLGLFECKPIPANERAGAGNTADAHVSVEERSLLCLVLPAPRLPRRRTTAHTGGVASVAFHVVVISIVVAAAAWPRWTPRRGLEPSAQPTQVPRLVFLLRPGPGGGGGGGGEKQPLEPSRAKAIGHDRLTVPVTRRPPVTESTSDTLPPPQPVLLDAKPLASGTAVMAGLLESSPSLPFSRGPGSGGGVGTGTGSGIGSGLARELAPDRAGGSAVVLTASAAALFHQPC